MNIFKYSFLLPFLVCVFISCSHQTTNPLVKKNMKDEVQDLIDQKVSVKKKKSQKTQTKKINKEVEGLSVGKKSEKTKVDNKNEGTKIVRVISDSIRSTANYLENWKRKSDHFIINETSKYRVSLMGINMGELTLSTIVSPDNDFFLFKGHLKNKSFYKYLYSVNDLLETKVLKDGVRIIQVDMSKNENGASSLSVQRTLNKEVLFVEKTIKKKKKTKKERVVKFNEYYFDPLSFIKLVEIVDVVHLKNNDIPVIFRGKLYYMKVKNSKTVNRDQTIYFDTLRNGKIKKDQKIVFVKRLGETPKIIKLRGKMKVGELRGEIIE